MSKEHTFLENGKVVYHMISDERIREIIREEIAEYNKIFMSKTLPNFEEEEVTATKMPIQAPVKLCSGEDFENMPSDDNSSQESKQRRDYNKRWVQGK